MPKQSSCEKSNYGRPRWLDAKMSPLWCRRVHRRRHRRGGDLADHPLELCVLENHADVPEFASIGSVLS